MVAPPTVLSTVLKTNAQPQTEATQTDTDTGARGGVRFLLEAMRGHWRAEGSSVAAALICTVAIVVIPELGGRAVDSGLIGHHWRTLGILGGIIAVLGVVQAVTSGLRRYYNGIASRTVEAELRRSFFTRLLGFDVGYHDRVNRGQLLSRVTSDLFQIQALVSSTPVWIANTITIVAVAVILVVINPLLGLIAVAGLPIVAYTSLRYSSRVRPILGELQRERGDLAGVVEEALSGIRAVKGFGAESILERRLGRQADAVRARSIEIVRMRCRYNPLLNVMPMFELVAVNWFGGYLVLHHELTVGMLLAFNTYLAVVTGPLQAIGWFIVQVQRALVSARRLETVMSHRVTIREPAQPLALPRGASTGRVSFDDVSFGYPGTDELVLDGFSLEIASGEVVALVGHDRLRQDDRGCAARSSLRPDFGCGADRRCRPSPLFDRHGARCSWGRVRGQLPFRRHDRGEPASRATGSDRRANSCRRRRSRRLTSSSPTCRAGTTASSASAGCRCPAASASESRSLAESLPTRGCSCLTTRRRRSTPRRSARSSRALRACRTTRRSCSSLTERRLSRWPIAWC